MTMPVPQETRRAEFAFTGSGFGLLGWGILIALAQIVILPTAWAAAACYRWFFEKLRLSDGTQPSFTGGAEQAWGWYALVGVLWWVQQAPRLSDEPGEAMGIGLLVMLLSLPLSTAVWLNILRWIVASVNVGTRSPLRFTGSYGGYLGWSLLSLVSMITIVGWAWVTVGLLQWMCRNVEGEPRFTFVGSGWEVLWRGIATAAACMFIIPIPWVLAWLVRWYISAIHMEYPTVVEPAPG